MFDDTEMKGALEGLIVSAIKSSSQPSTADI